MRTLLDKIARVKQLNEERNKAVAELVEKRREIDEEIFNVADPYGDEILKLEKEIGLELYLAQKPQFIVQLRGMLYEALESLRAKKGSRVEVFTEGKFVGMYLVAGMILSKEELEQFNKSYTDIIDN